MKKDKELKTSKKNGQTIRLSFKEVKDLYKLMKKQQAKTCDVTSESTNGIGPEISVKFDDQKKVYDITDVDCW
jgi:hypothetical protein